MFCSQCGTEMPNSANFCMKCGSSLSGTSIKPKVLEYHELVVPINLEVPLANDRNGRDGGVALKQEAEAKINSIILNTVRNVSKDGWEPAESSITFHELSRLGLVKWRHTSPLNPFKYGFLIKVESVQLRFKRGVP